MKKFKILLAASALLAAVGFARADQVVYQTKFVNETGLSYNTTYTLDLASQNIDFISMQAVYSTATFSSVSFNDGVASTATISVSSFSALVGARATALVNVANNTALAANAAADTITIASNTLTGAVLTFNGRNYYAGVDWTIATTATGTASNLATFLTNVNGLDAVAVSSVVYTTATVAGAFGNAYSLYSSTPAAMAIGSTVFTGGRNANGVVFTLNGLPLTSSVQWNVVDTASGTATNLAAAIAAASTPNLFTASATGSTVTITVVSSGTAGNSYTMASSTPVALTTSTFTGGKADAFLVINGVTLTNGVDFTASVSSSVTAKAISDAIQANTTLQPLIASTWTASGVVTATSTAVGANKNYGITTSTPNALALVGFKGGADSNILTASNAIAKTSTHSFTNGQPVLYTKSAGTSPGALVANTTYYVIRVDSLTFKLASSVANALAGTAVSIATQTLTGGGSFNVAPQAFTGSSAFKWQAGNDGVNFSDLSVSSVTVTSTTSSNTVWDFQEPQYRYLRLAFTAPTTGGIQLVVTGFGKQRYAK